MHEVGVQGLHVGFVDAGVGRIRHGRVQRTTVFDDAMAHGLVEVLEAVVAQPGFIRRDIGGVDRPDRRFHRQAAGERLAVLGGMASHAVTRAGEVLALFDQVLIDFCGVDRATTEQRQGRDNKCFHGYRSLSLNQRAGVFQVLLADRPGRPVGQSCHQAGRVVAQALWES